MAAILSTPFRKLNRENIEAMADDLFIGIGKSDTWANERSPATPTTSIRDLADTDSNLLGVKKVSHIAKMIPYVQYSTSLRYKAWDPTDPTCFYPSTTGTTLYPCYAISNDKLWMCVRNNPLSAPSSTSSLIVSGTGPYGVTDVVDGYQWAYICDINPESFFTSTQFVEVPDETSEITYGSGDATTATGGKIYSVGSVGGTVSGFTSGTLYAKVLGNYTTQATVAITVAGGTVTAITPYGTSVGAGYENYGVIGPAYSTIDGGGVLGGTIYTITNFVYSLRISPLNGFGFDPFSDLPTWFIGVGTTFSGSGDTSIVLTDFRQVSVLKLNEDSSGITDSANALNYIEISGNNAITAGSTIGISTTGSGDPINMRVFCDKTIYNSGDDKTRIYYHINSSLSLIPNVLPYGIDYTSGTAYIKAVNATTVSYSIVASEQSTYDHTGQVLFYENITKKTRVSGQTEQVAIIIQL